MKIKQTLCAIALTAVTALSGCATSSRYQVESETNFHPKGGYALRNAPNIGWMNGFGIAGKFNTFEIITDNETNKHTNNNYSSELSFNGTFGDKNLYEFGISNGAGSYGKKRSLELKAGLLRMGVISTGDVLWTPEVGAEMTVYPLFVETKGQGFVGKDEYRGFRFGLNAGLVF